MIQYLIKNAVTVRVADKEQADDLHKKIMEETLNKGWVLSSWTEKHKEKKQKGETIEDWFLITYTITFQEEKDPCDALDSIEYNMRENVWSD